MPIFQYKAYAAGGATKTGVIDARMSVTAGKMVGIVGKTCVTVEKIGAIAEKMSATAGKIEGTEKRMSVSTKEIGASIEAMRRIEAAAETDVVKSDDGANPTALR